MKYVHKYAQACRALAQEGIDELTEPDVQALRDELVLLGEVGWLQWQVDHNQDISEYLLATPSVRKKTKRWQAMKTKLALAAYDEFQRAAKLLAMGDEAVFRPGGSYRDTALLASELYWELKSFEPEPWPFAGESPFADEGDD